MSEFIAGSANPERFIPSPGRRVFIISPNIGSISVESGDPQIVLVEIERQILYTKRGFNASLAEFEYWQTNDPLEGPPSANPLIDITIVAQSN